MSSTTTEPKRSDGKYRDPAECFVICRECNAYCWSTSIYEAGGKTELLIPCPYPKECKTKR